MNYDNVDNDTFSILINKNYGGFGLSEKATELYNTRKREIDPLFIYNKNNVDRTDPILIQIYYELKDEINDQFAKLGIYKIEKKYKDCYEISEYDGSESIKINYAKYKLKKLQYELIDILNNNKLSSDEKINEIRGMEFVIKGII